MTTLGAAMPGPEADAFGKADTEPCTCCGATKAAEAEPVTMCCAELANGKPCRYRATREGGLCGVHRRSEDIATTCAICMGRVRKGRCRTLACGHAFHRRCIRRWFSRKLTCPCCRATCLEYLSMNGTALRSQLRLLLRTVPMPLSFHHFPSYMMALLNNEHVVNALHLTTDLRQLLADIAFFSFTADQFFGFLDNFRL